MSWRTDPIGNILKFLGEDVTEITLDAGPRLQAIDYMKGGCRAYIFNDERLGAVARKLKQLAKRDLQNDEDFLPGIYLALIQLIAEDKRVRGR